MRLLAIFLLVVVVCSGKSVEGPRRAVVNIMKGDISGKIILEQASPNSPVKIRGTVHGLEPGLHAMHIHEGKTLGAHCDAVGEHFNPTNKQHGGPLDPNSHVGDLGNIRAMDSGAVSRADINILAPAMSLYEGTLNSVLDRALVIHAKADDLGRGHNLQSLQTGNSGAHVACGLVEPVQLEHEDERYSRSHHSVNRESMVNVEKELHGREHGRRPIEREGLMNEENPWKEWAPTFTSNIPSNLNVIRKSHPGVGHFEGFELKTAVPTSKVWKVGNVYEYNYHGFVTAGIMGVGPTVAGGSISGRLFVESVDQHTINMALKIENGKMFNEDVLEEFVKADPGQEVRVMDQEHLEKPIQLKITNGKIESVWISKDEPLWTVNFKRALAAQLQLQLDATSGVFHSKSGKESSGDYYAENTAYYTPEGCTTGECLTWYHISRIPIQQINANPQLLAVPELCDGVSTPVYEIVKNRDFDRCHVLPYYNFINAPGLGECDFTSGSGCKNANAHADMVRILGCKVDENTFIVQRIKVMDRLVTKPLGYETEAIEGLTIQNFQLVNIRSHHSNPSQSGKLNVPRNAQVYKTLVYAFDEEHSSSGPRMSQPGLRNDNNPLVMEVDQQTAIRESERLLTEILHELNSNEFYVDPSGKFVAAKMNMLHKALSNLDFEQLNTFVNKFYTLKNPTSTANQVVINALVNAGTNPALMIVRDWILNGRLHGEYAVRAITTLPGTVKTPTKELLSNLINLLKSNVVVSHQQLKFATALSVTRIVYQACVNTTQSINMFPKLAMGEFCSVRDPLVTRQLVPWLNEQLKSATDDVERIAMMAALGNIGHEVIVPSIMPHISSCEPGTTFEAEWYERHRRSKATKKEEQEEMEEPLSKKEWRQKWLAYKKKHSKGDASLEEMMDSFESELKSDKKEAKGRGKDYRKGSKKHGKEELKSYKKEEKDELKSYKQMSDALKEESLSALPKSQQHRKDQQFIREEMKSGRKEDREDMKFHKKEGKEEDKDMKSLFRNAEKRQKDKWSQDRAEYLDDEEMILPEEDEELVRFYGEQEGDEDEEIEESYATELAEDQASCNILRTKAIYALSTLAVDQNPIVAKILMPIYFNKAEETEIRLAALSLLFVSVPPTVFWERVALSTWTESNDQVSHYIYTTISSLVQNKDPKRREVTERAEAVIPMMKPMRWTSLVSSNFLKAGYQEKTRLGYLTKTVNFPGFESFFPANHYNSLYIRAGPWFSRLFDISINSKQAEKFIDRLLGKPASRYSGKKDESSTMHPEFDRIHQDLKMEARATGQPEIFIYVNWMDNYQRFFAITPRNLENLAESVMSQSTGRNIHGESGFNVHAFAPLVDVFVRVPSAMGLAYSTISQVRLFASLKADLKTSVDFRSFKSLSAGVEGTVLPVLNLEMASKVTVEMPWARTYPTAGVNVEATLASPGRLSLAGDLQTGKVMSSWEFMGDKLRLARWAVVPFTTIRRVGDYTPSLLLKETKPIMLLNRPNTEDYTFGQRSLGMNFLYNLRGDVQALKAPMSYDEDWLGTLLFSIFPSTMRFQERNIFLDNAQSETKTIKTTFSFALKGSENVNPEEELMDEDEQMEDQMFSHGLFSSRKAAYDHYLKKMKAGGDVSDSRADQEWHQRKFQHAFRSMVQPSGLSMDATIELTGRSSNVQPRRYGTSMSYGIGDYGLSHRGKLMMEKHLAGEPMSSGEDNFVFCVDLEAKMPKPSVVRREEFLHDDLSRTSSINIGFGKSCTNDRRITITTRMARSEEEIPSTVHTKWQDRECAKQEMFGRGVSEQCLSTRRLASTLNKGVVVIDYNEMPPVVRNMTVKASNLFSRWMGAHMSDNQVDVTNTPNQIRIETVYYPVIGSMDLRVYKPKSNTFYHGIEVHPIAEAVLPFNPRLTAFRALYGGPGLCLVDRNSVTTYDGLTYNASTSGCDQLVTKDCSGRYKMAVLSRHEGNKKVVTVLLNTEKIELNAAAMRVKVNEKDISLGGAGNVQQIRDSEGNVLANIRKTSDGFIELDSPSHWIRVTVDPNELVILNSPIHRGRLCGLCGTMTGHKVTDLTGPRKCSLPEDLMDVAYEIRSPAGCKSNINPADREILSRLQDRCMREESSAVFGLSDRRPLMPRFQQHKLSLGIRSVSDESEGQCEMMRNRMIHRGRKRCFSIESALKCAEGCQPTAFENVKMGFHCIVAGDPLSDELKEAMATRPLDELAGQDVTNFAVMRIPTGCTPAPGFGESMMMPKIKEHRMH